MRKFTKFLIVGFALFMCQVAIHAQTSGSISGTVADSTGAVVPGASVTVKGESGQSFAATTNSSGAYNIPGVPAGTSTYTVTITAANFKTSVFKNVKVDVATPATVNAALEAGKIEETVVITSGGEVLQTETAKVGTTITGRQIIETPIASRVALDLVLLLPGTAQAGRPRASSINGLPKGTINISLDGVDAQDNANRSTDGFFTYIQPRIDAIDEVTVSTSNPGSESGGDGAVQIKFVTRRGTNDFTGGLFWQHRNTALNSNYWFNNRDNIPRQKIILNQYGGHFGGPIPFLGLGEGVPAYNSGKDSRFFFINYEEYRNPESATRTRVILTPLAQSGVFSYVTGAGTQTVNLYNLATTNGQLNTPDPTIAAALNQIRAATATTGTITPITNNPNRSNYNFTNSGLSIRTFLALRMDFNLTKHHSLEFVFNRDNFTPGKDFLNSRDEVFPGFPFQGQSGVRKSITGAIRSTFGNNIINEARASTSYGTTAFFLEQTPADYAFTNGLFLNIGAAAALNITNPYNGNSNQTRATPTYDLTDSVTWVTGNHTVNFGGQLKFIRTKQTNGNRIVPTVGFGIDSTEGTAFTMFNAANFPGSTTAQQTEARGVYAALIGRVSSYDSNAYLDGSGKYVENGALTQEFGLRTYGLFVQDSWRIRPGLTLSYGVRWQPQEAFTVHTGNVGKLENWEQVYGIGGKNGIFQPGATGGSDPRVVLYRIGEKAYKDDFNNYAPSVGIVWSPELGKGMMGRLFGTGGRSVIRAGYSRAFVREGSATQTIVTNNTPGGSIPLSRSTSTGVFTVGSNLRTPGNPNITTPGFSATPSFPLALTTASQALAVDPNLVTGTVDSYSFGYQREVDKNTVVEVRYVGNRGKNLTRLNFVNENNTIENGFGAEFRLAQANLYANIANGFTSSGFAYRGPGTGTSPLPIMLSYFTNFGSAANLAAASLVTANYTATNFANSTLVTALSINAPSLANFIGSSSFENSATRRANAIANGRPSTFFRVNPAVPAGSFLLQSDAHSWYDSGVIEVRRRLSGGLRVQASYVFSKAQSDAAGSSGGGQSNYTLRPGGLRIAKNFQPFDIRHAFKIDTTYDLPFGKGRMFFGNANAVVDAIVGGWTISPTVKIQSGSPISFGNVQLIGMSIHDLEKAIDVRKGPTVVTFLPADIILNTQRAFDISVTGAGGYGTQFGGGGAPTGRFLAPAGYGNCQSQYSGNCGFQNLIVHGPAFRTFDVAVGKRVGFGERRSVELRATFLDVLNKPSFRIGGWANDVVTSAVGGSTFGQLGAGTAYQDLSTTNNPGGRVIDLLLRINF
ncbi:MAG: carboxypeptidase regulatory-like domain-containing protein [Pyrinomonadaceae bacterium]